MTFACVPITVETIDSALNDAHEAKRAGAELVEFRIDRFFQSLLDQTDADQSPERERGDKPTHGRPSSQPSPDGRGGEIIDLVARSPVPCIITCRIKSEGGSYAGSNADRAMLFQTLADADSPPRYIDIELASLEQSDELKQFVAQLANRPDADAPPRIILSTHDFDTRPTDFTRRLTRMRETAGVHIIKIAHRARSLRDNLELFELLTQRDRPTIALAMGEFGLMSRVLAPKFGGFLTFASLHDATETAPGQPTLADLINLYRFRSITPKTKVFGVIGWPIAHSLSPTVHNAGFDATDFDGVYLPLPVPPEWEHFKATFGSLIDDESLDFAGASVTIPHKEHLIRFAQERADEGWQVDPLALAAGAANTAAQGADGWFVANTDVPAVVASLRAVIPDLQGKSVLILGAGGVSRAAAAGLVEQGAHVIIANRTGDRAHQLVDDLAPYAKTQHGQIEIIAWEEAAQVLCTAIINATSVGMTTGPAPDQLPVDLDSLAAINSDLVVFDTVYTPLETPLLASARQLSLRTISGAELFVRQAELQFSLWTGEKPSAQLFDQLVRDRLSTE
jgi:3-dehydroquinate dehydratase / shikimate dehydrogenase